MLSRPVRNAQAAPHRSTSRPATKPNAIDMAGPTDIAAPTHTVSSPSPPERKNGPITSVAIITVATSAFMSRAGHSVASRQRAASAAGAPRPAAWGKGVSGRCRRVSQSASTPRGTIERNMARQSSQAISRPPAEGPSAVPTADMLASQPMTLPARSLGTVSATRAMASAIMVAAPRPWTARAAIRASRDGDRAQKTDDRVNSSRPVRSSRRRPSRSPIRPATTTTAVMASR